VFLKSKEPITRPVSLRRTAKTKNTLPLTNSVGLIFSRKRNQHQVRAATVSKHRKGRSLFQLIDRRKFDALVKEWDVDKGIRSLTTWELTQALLCCFVPRLGSFREVEAALGIRDSTFGDALRERHFGFFQGLCDLVLLEIRAKTESRKVKNAVRQTLALSEKVSQRGVLPARARGPKSDPLGGYT
jgi:hypothetical protein